MDTPEYMRREMELIDRVEADVPISDEELREYMLEYPSEVFYVFPEDRERPTYIRYGFPQRWKSRKPNEAFFGEARPGEYYVFQIGVFAVRPALKDVRLKHSAYRAAGGKTIGAEAVTTISAEGVDCLGRPLAKRLDVACGELKSLWVGVDVPPDAQGTYEGEVAVRCAGLHDVSIPVTLKVSGEALPDGGVSEPWRHARLKWLNSALAIDEEVTAPYGPLAADGDRAYRYLGRRTEYGAEGLPARLTSFFTPDVMRADGAARELLAAPVRFTVRYAGGGEARLNWKEAKTVSACGGKAVWASEATDGRIRLKLEGFLEYEGFNGYRIALEALEAVDIEDVCLEIPYKTDAAKYWLGLGNKGGPRNGHADWKWDTARNQDTLWMGDVNAGLMLRLLDDTYEKPHMIFYYTRKPLNLPLAWDNRGLGGIRTEEKGQGVTVTAYSGAFSASPGETRRFFFDLYITPVKPIDTNEHWNVRYMHAVKEPAEVKAAGANLVNVHHGNLISPYINFPFLEHQALKEYVDACHQENLKVKLYYTVKEMTHKQTEIWAFAGMDSEIIADGPGVGNYKQSENGAWYRRYFGRNYIQAWTVKLWQGKYKGMDERSVVVNPMSRYNNYYLEDINWLVEHVGIDGIYLDDIAADRTIMRRMRKVLDRGNPGSMIDLHGWNYFPKPRAGHANSVGIYIDNFAYIDRMWFGEGFSYDEEPDYWLIEMCGIPFGMMGEMLHEKNDPGNAYRGMVFGMSSRMPSVDISDLWRFWDEFGIQETRLLGYWNPECPVNARDPRARASAYVKPGKALIALANWDNQEAIDCALDIDWKALGVDPAKARLYAPKIENYQDETIFDPAGPVRLEPRAGWLLVLEPNE